MIFGPPIRFYACTCLHGHQNGQWCREAATVGVLALALSQGHLVKWPHGLSAAQAQPLIAAHLFLFAGRAARRQA
eukprot:2445791-Pleurochrysis_carterae.AAC.2